MAERFEKLYTLTPYLYAENCPIIIEAGALQKDRITGDVLAQIKLQNIGEKTISSCKISIKAYESNGSEVEGVIDFSYLDLDASKGKVFGSKVPVFLPDRTARSFAVSVNEIVFSDGEVSDVKHDDWRPLPEQKNLQDVLADVKLVKQYRLEVGEFAKNYPEKKDGFFLCTCGAVNYDSAEKCYNCGWAYDDLIKKSDKHYLADQINAKLSKEREKSEKRKRLIKIIVIVAVAVSVLVAVICGVVNMKQKKLEPEICASLVGNTYTDDYRDDGFGGYIRFEEDYLYMQGYNSDGTTFGGACWDYGIKRVGLSKYVIDIADSEDELFANGDYDWVVTKIEGTQIVEIDNYVLD